MRAWKSRRPCLERSLMRRRTISVAIIAVLLSVVIRAARPWSIELEWGDSIPGGTVYSVTIGSTGKLHAERKGLPITSKGLTVTTYERTLPDASAAGIRAAGETFIRQLDLDKTQGHMAGDGGFASVYVWDGSVTLGARLSLLKSREEAGKEWNNLLSTVTESLPKDFIR
jgi:hypothetical protein